MSRTKDSRRNSPDRKGDPAISSVVSLRQAGHELNIDPKYLKGFAEAIGIQLQPMAKSLLMDRGDFERIKAKLKTKSPACEVE